MPKSVSAKSHLVLIGFIISSKTFPNCVLAKIQSHPIGVLLRQFQNLSQPKINCISWKFFYDNSELFLSPNSIAPHRISSNLVSNVVSAKIQLLLMGFIIFSKTIPNCVLAKIQSINSLKFFEAGFKCCLSQKSIASHQNSFMAIPNFVWAKVQLHLIGIFLRQFQNLSQPNFNCFSWDFFIYSKTFANCVLSEIQLHLIGLLQRQFQNLSQPNFNCFSWDLLFILRHFQTVSQPKFICISSDFLKDNSNFCLSQFSIASHRNSSETFPNFVSAKIQLHLIGSFLREFQNLSKPKLNCISSEIF